MEERDKIILTIIFYSCIVLFFFVPVTFIICCKRRIYFYGKKDEKVIVKYITTPEPPSIITNFKAKFLTRNNSTDNVWYMSTQPDYKSLLERENTKYLSTSC